MFVISWVLRGGNQTGRNTRIYADVFAMHREGYLYTCTRIAWESVSYASKQWRVEARLTVQAFTAAMLDALAFRPVRDARTHSRSFPADAFFSPASWPKEANVLEVRTGGFRIETKFTMYIVDLYSWWYCKWWIYQN